MSDTEKKMNERKRPLLWDRILGLLERDLAERRAGKLFVEVPDESGSYYEEKEIGELSIAELRSLDPALKGHVAERLLDRYLAEQGHVDLIERRRAYRKKIGDLAPEDLPALIEADRLRAEEERRNERERTEFVRETRADLERLLVIGFAEISEAGKEVRR